MGDFVEVNLIYEGSHYSVEVDESSEYDELLDGLLSQLSADRTKKYEVVIRGAVRLVRGATLEVRPASGDAKVRALRKQGG